MHVTERAVQIWSVLKLAATNRQVLTYGMLSQLVGVAPVGLGQCLDPIQRYCLQKNLPPLTILVVNKDTGLPGMGFSAAQDIPAYQVRVFEHDWLSEVNPTPEVFAAVMGSA